MMKKSRQREKEIGHRNSRELAEKESALAHAALDGERALTSIALIFAMSQVNPPPFLILDETNAALAPGELATLWRYDRELGAKVTTHRHYSQSRNNVACGISMASLWATTVSLSCCLSNSTRQ
jgi:chromosome segregation protein